MVGFLIDLDTGNPVIDVETGNLIPVDDFTAIKQVIFMLLNTEKGSETLHKQYGFDIESALRLSHVEDAEMYIENLIADALDPTKEKLISNVNYIKATRDSTDPRKIKVSVNLDTINAQNISITQTIGD
jgi:phage baseplate assembly protein W